MASLPRPHAACRKPKLRGQLRQAIRTEEAYVPRIKRLVFSTACLIRRRWVSRWSTRF